VIILGAFNTEPVEFRVETADALEDADVARLAEGFADHFRLHGRNLLHYPAKVKKNLRKENTPPGAIFADPDNTGAPVATGPPPGKAPSPAESPQI
jgi:hypothetical protein